MEIETLRKKYPELVHQIEQEAVEKYKDRMNDILNEHDQNMAQAMEDEQKYYDEQEAISRQIDERGWADKSKAMESYEGE